MRNIIKKALFAILLAAQRISAPFIRQKTVAVLMYHSIGPGSWEFTVTQERFEEQIRYLIRQEHQFLSADEVARIVAGSVPMPEKGILITFDDGYRDILVGAAPVLREHGIPAVVFVHTDRQSRELRNTLPLLTWEDIRTLKERYRFEVGGHSHSHPNMKTLSAPELAQELQEVNKVFQAELGFSPRIFAYPGGKFNETVVHALRERGYQLAFTINRGPVNQGDNPFLLKRNGVSAHTSLLEFKVRTGAAGGWYERIAQLLKP